MNAQGGESLTLGISPIAAKLRRAKPPVPHPDEPCPGNDRMRGIRAAPPGAQTRTGGAVCKTCASVQVKTHHFAHPLGGLRGRGGG
jgi:hypothetical protein